MMQGCVGRHTLRSTQRAATSAFASACRTHEGTASQFLRPAAPAAPCLTAARRHLSASATTAAAASSSDLAAVDPSIAALTTSPPAPLFVTTRHHVSGRVITHDLGLVAASAFRSRNLLIDVLVAVTRIFGGETPDYTVLLNECTEKATQRLEATARAAGATSVVGVRFSTTTTMNRMIVGLHCSVLASGTAVIDVPEAEATPQQMQQHAQHNTSGGSGAKHRTVPLLRTPHSNARERAEHGAADAKQA